MYYSVESPTPLARQDLHRLEGILPQDCDVIFTYGGLFLGPDVLRNFWPRTTRLFSICPSNQSHFLPGRTTRPEDYQRFERINWNKFWRVHQVPHVLLVWMPSLEPHEWEEQFLSRPEHPRLLVVWEGAAELLSHHTEEYRSRCKRLEKYGYGHILKHVRGDCCGAPVWSSYLVTIFYQQEQVPPDALLFSPIGQEGQNPRGIANCLLYTNIPRWTWARERVILLPEDATPLASNHEGHCEGLPVFDEKGPAPPTPFMTRSQKGIRRVTPTEWQAIRGYPASWEFSQRRLHFAMIRPGAHEWNALGKILVSWLNDAGQVPSVSGLHLSPREIPEVEVQPVPPPWTWRPPDLGMTSAFYRQRTHRLRQVSSLFTDQEDIYAQGLQDLASHRLNYGDAGPQDLVVLWWEWPADHWEELRRGASMNFVGFPPPGLIENSKFSPDELATAVQFVDELVSLRVLHAVPRLSLRNNLPLFLVPKPGQPGQYRCIVDGAKGGQNACCVADPVHFYTLGDILPFLYRGGWSAMIDASKFFHMFRTLRGERPYLGMIHPATGQTYSYHRLPMGTRNSPAVACRFGNAFIRYIVETCPLFQGTPVHNDFVSQLLGNEFRAEWGIGRVLLGPNGEPALLIWMHVNDILVHGPSFDKVSRGLDFIMNTALRFGLICQPVKTKPPAQEQKFCGFIYNTVGIPYRAIPTAKIGRALAVLSYVRHGAKGWLAKLSIAILAGLLQSFVPATPGNVGANFLRALYEVVHRDMTEEVVGTPQGYYEEAHLTPDALGDLDWWGRALQGGIHRCSQVKDSSILSINFGDGSGTGSGGTAELYGSDGMVLQGSSWMGTWRSDALQKSSNYKELRTLLEFFLRVAPSELPFRHRRLFYFTDNTTTYDVVRRGGSRSPGLHQLVREIKAQELLHSTMLEVVHVPGTTMIGQGTDGLSRGLWITSLNRDPTFSVSSLFLPVSYTPELNLWIRHRLAEQGYEVDPTWLVHADMDPWTRSSMMHRSNLWLLSPSIA